MAADTTQTKTITVGVSDCIVSSEPSEVLLTYSLGSCVGVTLYDPVVKVGGMLHFKLPESKLNPSLAAEKPATFGDSGLELLLDQVFKLGATRKNLQVKIAGGAKALAEGSFFDIGSRNVLMARRMLWRNDLLPKVEETGGTESRTLRLYMEDGRLTVKDSAGERDL
jgi:chemotaxis protein CheD